VTIKRAYPEANVALHYRRCDEIDWCALVGATEFELVLTTVLLREVEQQKDRGRGAIQRRARKMASWWGGLHENGRGEIRPGVRVVPAPLEPEVGLDFAVHSLVPTVADDRFLACILRDGAHLTHVEIVWVSADGLSMIKADARGIPVVRPRESDRLPDEPDQQERELRELRKRLYKWVENKALPPSEEPRSEIEVHPGDLVMSRASGSRSVVGSCAIATGSPVRLMLSAKHLRLRVNPHNSVAVFLCVALSARPARCQLEIAISGAEGLASNLPQSELKKVVLAVPPIVGQRAIVAFLGRALARHDRLIRQLTVSVDKLREYRQALVSAAVTGKLDVTKDLARSAPLEAP
jgi:hypothetical protein